MANRTDPAAKSVHGTNPQNLVEKILREKIHQSSFWKEQCFGLTAETLVDKAMELNHVGGTYGGSRKATPFMCLTLKMLQIQPEKEIVVEFIKNEDYKYVRVLGAFYLRLVGKATDVYQYLEPLYNDYRKIRLRKADGAFALSRVDEFIDELLTSDYSCDIALPRVPKRSVLEQNKQLEPRKSALEEDFEEEEKEDEEEAAMELLKEKEREKEKEKEREKERERRHRDRSYDDRQRDRRDRDRDRDRDHRDHYRRDDRDRERDSERGRDIDRDRSRGRDRDRDRDRERDRERGRDRHSRRSRSRSKERRDNRDDSRRNRSSPGRRGEEPMEEGEHRPPENEKKKKKTSNAKDKKAGEGPSAEDPEIIEANKLRAKLGLKPLRL